MHSVMASRMLKFLFLWNSMADSEDLWLVGEGNGERIMESGVPCVFEQGSTRVYIGTGF